MAADNSAAPKSGGGAPRPRELTPLAVAALGLLIERPMHPYEMFQTLMDRHEDRVVKVRPSTLYHAVAVAVRLGLAREIGVDRAGNRPERTTYEITADGRARLSDWLRRTLAEPAEEYPVFAQAASEAHNLPRDEARALLQQRRHALAIRLAEFQADVAQAASDHVPTRFYLDATWSVQLLVTELTWLDQVLVDLGDEALAWGPDMTPEEQLAVTTARAAKAAGSRPDREDRKIS